MSLPSGWVISPIGEAFELNPKHAAETDRDLIVSFVPMPTVDEFEGTIKTPEARRLREIWKGYTHFADGDVIFAKITPCMENGKAAIVRGMANGIACGSTEFHVFRPLGGVQPSYLWRYLRQASFREIAERQMNGAVGQKRVPRDFLETYKIPLPPLAEQHRIVAKLDALTTRLARARTELDRVPMLVRKMKQQALIECFSEMETVRVQLGTLLNGIESGKNMRCEERPPHAGELGVVKVSAVSWGRFDPDQSKTLPPDYNPPEKARIREGDLLISRANTLELVGAVVIVDNQPDGLFLSDKILRLVVEDEAKKWILWFLRSPLGRKQIEELATGNQLSMRNISQDALRSIRLPFPDSKTRIRLMKDLEATFARADRVDAEAARARKLLDRLDSAVLAKAFRGELVPQDPTDEPASILLERIRAQRTFEPSKRRRSARDSATF